MPLNKGYPQDGRPEAPPDGGVKVTFKTLGRAGTSSGKSANPEDDAALQEEAGGVKAGPKYSSLTRTERASLPKVDKPPSGSK